MTADVTTTGTHCVSVMVGIPSSPVRVVTTGVLVTPDVVVPVITPWGSIRVIVVGITKISSVLVGRPCSSVSTDDTGAMIWSTVIVVVGTPFESVDVIVKGLKSPVNETV